MFWFKKCADVVCLCSSVFFVWMFRFCDVYVFCCVCCGAVFFWVGAIVCLLLNVLVVCVCFVCLVYVVFYCVVVCVVCGLLVMFSLSMGGCCLFAVIFYVCVVQCVRVWVLCCDVVASFFIKWGANVCLALTSVWLVVFVFASSCE